MITSRYVTHSIVVKPNFNAILSNLKFLIKEKYIEEHISIYNKQRPSEYRWFLLRICLGSKTMEDFHSAPGPKMAFPFTILESSIVKFLKDFRIFWHGFLTPQLKVPGKV
jgi:hypothetical protein